MLLSAAQHLTEWVLGATAVLLIVYDIVIAIVAGNRATISAVLPHIGLKCLILVLGIGIVLGHVFWFNPGAAP